MGRIKTAGTGILNLLGKEDVWDNLMRSRSAQIAAELLEIALKEYNEIVSVPTKIGIMCH